MCCVCVCIHACYLYQILCILLSDEECIVAATVSQTSAMAPKPSNGKDQLVANVIKAAVASPCGDKGNPYYAEELNRENKGK